VTQAHNMSDYETTYAEFRPTVPEYFNFAGDVVDKWAQDPGKLAILWVDDAGNEVRKTFWDLVQASKKLANVLTASGVRRDDVILVVLPRDVAWWETLTAGIRMGALLAPSPTQLNAKDLAFRANTSRAVCLITNHDIAAQFEQVQNECPTVKTKIVVSRPRKGWIFYEQALAATPAQFETVKTRSSDNCLVYFTSGTAGTPKMALHTHASYPIGHQSTGRFWLDLRPADLHWNVGDTGWAKAAWSSYFGPWHCGAALFVHHSERFDPVKTLELLERHPITTLCGTPTVYRMLILHYRSASKFPALRHCVAAGEPLGAEIIEVWKRATGITICDGYGQTETVLLAGGFPCLAPRFGSMGKPAPGIALGVIGGEGAVLPANTEGDIAVRVEPTRPVGLFKEYWQAPESTAAVFRNGWYLTGDRGYVDEDGYFWFVGRSDDVILSSGYRIGPFEVESALGEHPAVAEAAVVSSPDQTRGEVVKAFIVLAPGFAPSSGLVKELQQHVKRVCAPYKYPRKIAFVDALPKTVSGKIRRGELRNTEWGNA
jgi:acyl-coenzyme A synthetase/AMP-(fatty) acid ligase